MRHRMLIPFLAILLVAATAAAAAPGKATAPSKPDKMHLTGKLVSVNMTDQTITLEERATEGKTKQVVIKLEPDTKIMVKGKAATLADLKAGEEVKVGYVMKEGKHVAETVHVA